MHNSNMIPGFQSLLIQFTEVPSILAGTSALHCMRHQDGNCVRLTGGYPFNTGIVIFSFCISSGGTGHLRPSLHPSGWGS